MATKKNKAVFVVLKYPYNHPNEEEPAPVGSEVDLSHLPISDRARLVEKGRMKATTADALIIPAPVAVEKIRRNKHGLPYGQVPPKSKEAK